MLGAPVVHQLRADGFAVRVMARDPDKAAGMLGEGFEVVGGDVSDLASLEAALDGCEGAHISVGGPVDQVSAENVAALASRLGLERITYLSGSTVSEQNRWFPTIDQKLRAEEAIQGSGVSYTILCPTWPMEQLPRFVVGGRAAIWGQQPTPIHWFAAEDLGAMVSGAFQQQAAANKRLYVHGPEAIRMHEALERYCQAFHPEIEAVAVVPIDAARAMAASSGNEMLQYFAELMAYFDQAGELGDPAEANELLGAPDTTLDAWIQERKGGQV
jgi:uncharacterized protein YbjT (DUF2867 family)